MISVHKTLLIEEILNCNKNEIISKELANLPFGKAIAPWIVVARSYLLKRIEHFPPNLTKTAQASLEQELIELWSKICTPAFVTQMHLARYAEKLSGETSEERYDAYITEFLYHKATLKALFQEYPLMEERVYLALVLWVDKIAVFFNRLSADSKDLQTRFGQGSSLTKIHTIKFGLSDPHNGNSSVYELIFDSGRSIFYKPKSLGIDATFTDFLSELIQLGLKPDLRGYQVWDRGSYGWSEKVECKHCLSEVDVEEYYKRAGSLLCLLYLLGGTDIHYENLIANGAYPVIIDLESLLHPQLLHWNLDTFPEEWQHSVMRVGMLPNFMFGEMGLKGIDISALGSVGGQKIPSFIPFWKQSNTDLMHLAYVQPVSEDAKNQVRLQGTNCKIGDYVEPFIASFKTTYEFLQDHRDLLLKKNGWLDKLSRYPVRYICRPTRLYLKLQQQLLDPSCLRDKASQKEILDILPRYLLENDNAHLFPLVEEESRAMKQGDIPFFQIYPKSKDLFHNGKAMISNVAKETSYESVKRLIENMSPEKCADQIELIRQSFYVRDYGKKNNNPILKNAAQDCSVTTLTDAFLLQEAQELGDHLLSKARRDAKGGLHWLGIESLPSEDSAVLASLSPHLYGGSLGVSLFFGALYVCTKKTSWKNVALASVKPFLDRLEKQNVKQLPGAYGIGGMSGVGSMIYCLNHLASFLDLPEIENKALILTNQIDLKHIKEDNRYDLLSGSAGLILSFVSGYHLSKKSIYLKLAHLAASHLKEKAQVELNGVSWHAPGAIGLLGFSHGNAGIAYALEKFSVLIGDTTFLDLANSALDYEKSLFSEKHQNWPSFRNEKPHYDTSSWCHGATGIGLARLASPLFAQDQFRLKEIRTAIEITKKSFRFNAHHLCCGDLGRADFLWTAAKKLQDNSLLSFANKQIACLIQHAKTNNGYIYSNVLPADTFSPGFMQGLSGIGYSFLRYTKQGSTLPHVLLLE